MASHLEIWCLVFSLPQHQFYTLSSLSLFFLDWRSRTRSNQINKSTLKAFLEYRNTEYRKIQEDLNPVHSPHSLSPLTCSSCLLSTSHPLTWVWDSSIYRKLLQRIIEKELEVLYKGREWWGRREERDGIVIQGVPEDFVQWPGSLRMYLLTVGRFSYSVWGKILS